MRVSTTVSIRFGVDMTLTSRYSCHRMSCPRLPATQHVHEFAPYFGGEGEVDYGIEKGVDCNTVVRYPEEQLGSICCHVEGQQFVERFIGPGYH